MWAKKMSDFFRNIINLRLFKFHAIKKFNKSC